jgi:hypothetical protein
VQPEGSKAMSIPKAIEVLAESNRSWEDAAKQAIENEFLELNAHPARLDLDHIHCEQAKKMGLGVAKRRSW